MKRVRIEIDERLLSEGMKITSLGSATDLVDYAVRELVRRERKRRLSNLKENTGRGLKAPAGGSATSAQVSTSSRNVRT